jgi:hypothetical protein
MTDASDAVDPEDEAELRENLRFTPGETVTVPVRLPSAVWARVYDDLADREHSDTVAEWIETATHFRLQMYAPDDDEQLTIQPDVALDAETWERIRLLALSRIQAGEDPEFAFWDAVEEHVDLTPNLVVEDVVKGPADLAPGLDGEDDDGAEGEERDGNAGVERGP